MKQIKRTEIKTLLEEVVSVRCDRCGKEYSVMEDMMEIQEFKAISFIGGYGSVFGDGMQIECDICQHCLREMIGEFCRYINVE